MCKQLCLLTSKAWSLRYNPGVKVIVAVVADEITTVNVLPYRTIVARI